MDAIVAGNISKIRDWTRRALDEGVAAINVINEGIVEGLRVGRDVPVRNVVVSNSRKRGYGSG